jgi:putative peptidoglycan lipid II flippase
MSTQKTVTKAAAIMMAAILLSRVLGLVRDMVISGIFGQARNTDIYYAAFGLPDLLFYLIAGGVLSSAFVPVFVEYLSTDRREHAWHLFSIIATVMAVVVGVFIIIGEIFARRLVPYVAAPGFHSGALDQVAHLTRIVLPAQLFFFLGGLMMASLWAHNQFVAPGLGPSIYNIGIIVGGAIAGSQLGPIRGIEGLAWGALAGAFLGNFVLQLVVLRRHGLSFKPSFNVRHPGAVKVWKLMVPVIFSLSLTQVDVWVNRWFATWLFAGAVSALDRANRLMQVPIGVFGQAIAIGFYPTLAAQYSTGQMKEFRETVNYGLRAISFVAIPSTVLIIVLRVPIIQLLFQHGRFKAEATQDVASALAFYALGIFAWSGQALVARAFYSMQHTLTPVLTGTAMTAIFIPLNVLLMGVMRHAGHHMEHTGLALATTIAASGDMALLLFFLRRRAGGINARRILVSIGKICAASAPMGIGMWFTLIWVGHSLPAETPLKVSAGLRVLLPIAVGGALFLTMVRVLRMEEAATVWNMVRRRFVRRRDEEETMSDEQ